MWLGIWKGREHLIDLVVDGRILLKWNLKKDCVSICAGGSVAGCEHGNEPSNSLKRKEFVGHLSDYQFLKK
jgi:hypothetical protein